jgi:hypothetical protein
MRELNDVNIRHFKLSNGEELIALVQGEEDQLIKLESPMEVHREVRMNSQSFIFTKWLPLSKVDECLLNPMHVVSHVECDNDVKERYVRMCLDERSAKDNHISNRINVESDEDLDKYDEFLEMMDSSDTEITFH